MSAAVGGRLRLIDVVQPLWWVGFPISVGFAVDAKLGLAAMGVACAAIVYRWFTAPPTIVSRLVTGSGSDVPGFRHSDALPGEFSDER